MKLFRSLYTQLINITEIVLMVVASGIFILLWGKILQPLSPITTILFVIVGSALSWIHWKNGLISLLGIALYAASWPTTHVYGVWAGAPLWCIGVLLWFASLLRALTSNMPRVIPIIH
jgi:hypothetical protein